MKTPLYTDLDIQKCWADGKSIVKCINLIYKQHEILLNANDVNEAYEFLTSKHKYSFLNHMLQNTKKTSL